MEDSIPICFGRIAVVVALACGFTSQLNGGGDSKSDVKELIKSIVSENDLACAQALIEIAKIGPDASEAVAPICAVLASPNYSVRGLAVDALVAIGMPSVEPLKQMLKSKSPAARAATLQSLGRLNAISVKDVSQMANDPDPRVRAALAIGLANREQDEANSVLIDLVSDGESAVAVQACLAVKEKRVNPEIAIPALTKALSRREVAPVVVDTLASFGTDAQSCIVPLLTVSREIGRGSYSFSSPVESALKHIGPPNHADVERICRLLDPANHERTILVAETLSRMEVRNKLAADHLEKAIDRLIRHAVDMRVKFADVEDSKRHRHDNSGRVMVAAEYCAAAYWNVSGDAKRFVELVEKISRECESAVSFSSPTPWNTFSEKDVESVELLLSSTDPHVLESAYSAIYRLGPKATRYVDRVIELLDDKLSIDWVRPETALAAMGPKVAEKSVPALVKSFENGDTQLKDFARAINQIGIGSAECEAILVNGLDDRDSWTAAACAYALCRVSKEPEKIATLILRKCKSARTAIAALRLLPSFPNSVVEFYKSSLSNSDLWTRHEAVIALGELGPESRGAVDAIKPMLASEHEEERIQAAKALYLITDDAISFDRFLQTQFDNNKDRRWRPVKSVEAIGSLGDRGARFQHHLLEHRKWLEENRVLGLCAALKNIGNDESVKTLESIAKSKDWEAKSAALKALQSIKQSKQSSLSK